MFLHGEWLLLGWRNESREVKVKDGVAVLVRERCYRVFIFCE